MRIGHAVTLAGGLALGAIAGLSNALPGPPAGMDEPWASAPQTQHARASLIARDRAGVPGSTIMLGVTLTMDPGWHVYWDGLNDTGVPPRITLTLPEGFEAGEILWPAPHRHITGDRDLLDHIYEGQLTLIIPVRISKDIPAGRSVRIEAQVDWLICDEACLPESASLALDLPIAATPQGPSPDAPLFAKSLDRIPKPIKASRSPISADWDGTTLEIDAPQAAEILYYPGNDSSDLYDRFDDAVARNGPLRLRFEPRRGKPARASGVIELLGADRRTIGLYAIDLRRPAGLVRADANALRRTDHAPADPPPTVPPRRDGPR